MPRSVNHVASKAKRTRILKLTKGYYGARKNVWTVAKKSQQKMDRERREAEAKGQTKEEGTTETAETPANGGLFANAKNGADALKKLQK